ncbi:MAG TPA: hypothetical protein VE915_06370 [Actinomycetota bacterium]|nr:hypothetical protein [Actinomycetota bacterium]
MHVAAAFLCDFAEVRERLLFALGGGITRLWRESFPASMDASLALLLELHQMEQATRHDLQVVVQGEDGQRVGEVKGAFQMGAPEVEVGENLLVPIALDLRPARLPAPGSYAVEIVIDGTHQRKIQFRAMPRPEQPAS